MAINPTTRTKITGIRKELILLHKRLIELQQEELEKKYGRLDSPGELFNMVMHHPAFAWIRPLSELIVSMDTLLGQREQWEDRNIDSLLEYVRKMLRTAQPHTKFERAYYTMLQRDPSVVLLHAKIMQLLGAPNRNKST